MYQRQYSKKDEDRDRKPNQLKRSFGLDETYFFVLPLLCSDLSKVMDYKYTVAFVLQCFGKCISSDPSTSDMLDLTKMWYLMRTILRILQNPKVLMFLSVITIFFLLNR